MASFGADACRFSLRVSHFNCLWKSHLTFEFNVHRTQSRYNANPKLKNEMRGINEIVLISQIKNDRSRDEHRTSSSAQRKTCIILD